MFIYEIEFPFFINRGLLFLNRYKALDRLDQDRKLMLFQHLGFVHCPIREHCPAFPNCMDALIERILSNKVQRFVHLEFSLPVSKIFPVLFSLGHGFRVFPQSSNRWSSNGSSNLLNIVVLGTGGLGHEFASEIKVSVQRNK